MQEFNGAVPKPVAKVTFTLLDNGQVVAQCEAISPFAAFHAIGMGTAQLSMEFQKQAAQKIQVAPAGLLNRLPN